MNLNIVASIFCYWGMATPHLTPTPFWKGGGGSKDSSMKFSLKNVENSQCFENTYEPGSYPPFFLFASFHKNVTQKIKKS